MKKLYIGLKLYKFKEGNTDPDVIRITGIKHDKKLIRYITSDGKTKKMTFAQTNAYRILAPDGLLIASILNCGNEKDVAVFLDQMPKSTTKTKTDGKVPYVVCRQLAVDIFSSISTGDASIYGVCINVDSCPPNIPYNAYLACDSMELKKCVAVYLDDTLDVILSLIKTEKFDKTLTDIHDKYHSIANGFVTSLKELLEQNSFMFDFRRCFDIIELPGSIDPDFDSLSEFNADYLGKQLNKSILATYVVKYSNRIDTTKFARPHALVSSATDNHKDIYIVGYDTAL